MTTPTPPTQTPLTILQGTTWNVPITVTDQNGSLIDFTGYTIHMQVRETPSSGTTLLDLSTINGGITISTTTATVLATATQTAALNFGDDNTAYYDIKFTSPTGIVSRYLQGPILLDLEITV